VLFCADHGALGLYTALEQSTGPQRRDQHGKDYDAIGGEDHAPGMWAQRIPFHDTSKPLASSREVNKMERRPRGTMLVGITAAIPDTADGWIAWAKSGPPTTGAQVATSTSPLTLRLARW
jgi:hypothetical protein